MEVYKARYDYRKKIKKSRIKSTTVLVFLLVLILVTGGGYTTLAATKKYELDVPTALELTEYTPVDVKIDWPQTGQAAFGTVEDGLISSTNSEKKQPIASITKLITALTVLNEKPIEPGEKGEIYTIDDSDEKLFRDYIAKLGSVVPVNSGQKLTQYDMLNAMLLPSANNIADSLAIKVFGSMENYLQHANLLVNSYGLENTVVSDASGFSPKTVSTPSDLLILADYALNNEVLSGIMLKESYNWPGWGEVRNTNRLIGTRSGVIGLKTGTTDEAGYCLLFAENFKKGEHSKTITGVILGNTSTSKLYQDAEALLNSVERGFAEIKLLTSGTKLATLQTEWGQTTDYVVTGDLSVFGWQGNNYDLDIQIKSPSSAVITDEGAGTVSLGSIKLADIKTSADISQPGFWWRFQNVF